jgi:glutamyl-tRNA reductase
MIGVDHRTAAIELRERVAYGKEDGQELLLRLFGADEIAEASLLSTCNRTELYLLPQRDEASAYRLGLRLAFLERAPEIEAEGRFYVKRDREAAKHLFEVASGLQSMILGEPEILGQVKRAAGRT